MKNILIVDDNKQILEALSMFIRGYDESLGVLKAMNGMEAVEILKIVGVDLIMTDIQMPVMDGFALIEHRNRHCPHIPLIVMTGSVSLDTLNRLSALTITDIIEKPFDYNNMIKRVAHELNSESKSKPYTTPSPCLNV